MYVPSAWPDGTMEAFTGVAAGARWQLDRGTGRAR
jgi:hypothetical protein